MKDKRIYICEKCGLEIEEDYKAMIDHEHDHIEPSGYQQPEAKRYDKFGPRYPDIIGVKMRDGAVVEYSYFGMFEPPTVKDESPLPETEGSQGK